MYMMGIEIFVATSYTRWKSRPGRWGGTQQHSWTATALCCPCKRVIDEKTWSQKKCHKTATSPSCIQRCVSTRPRVGLGNKKCNWIRRLYYLYHTMILLVEYIRRHFLTLFVSICFCSYEYECPRSAPKQVPCRLEADGKINTLGGITCGLKSSKQVDRVVAMIDIVHHSRVVVRAVERSFKSTNHFCFLVAVQLCFTAYIARVSTRPSFFVSGTKCCMHPEGHVLLAFFVWHCDVTINTFATDGSLTLSYYAEN